MRKHLLQRCYLLMGFVPAVVDYDVERRNFPLKRLPELRAGLIADEDLDLFVFVSLTSWFDVNTVYLCLRPEVVFPHFQTPATVDSDLKDVNFTPGEAGKVTVINLEIVSPFPNTPSGRAGIEESFKRVVSGRFCAGEHSVHPMFPRGGWVSSHWERANESAETILQMTWE